MELLPQRAPVKPRALTEDRSDSLPLEDEILSLIQRGQCGIVGIFGPPGSGKTTALRHLMAVIQEAEIHYEDVNQESLFVNRDDFHEQLQRIQSHVEGPGLMLYASTFRLPVAHRAKFDLSPWGFDDVLEYLVHRHRDRCAAILNRQDDSSQAELLSDLPALWAPVLDLMAVSDPIPDCLQALELYSEKVFQDQNQEHATRIAILSAHQPVRPEVLEQRAILFTDSRSRALLQKDWQPTPNEKIVEALLRDELQEILKNRTPEVQNALSSKYEGLFVELADFKKEGSFAAAQLLQVRSVAHLSLARRIVRDLEAKKISEFLGTPMPLQFVELAGS
ncbi:MAG: hypothetical protein QF886_26135, partial [Planctomycetota bacterium]|nr:hypothetical protein [Planctomycetota bacterium]